MPAAAECLERYASTAFSEQEFVYATAEELGDLALDLDLVPKCSTTELLSPLCPLVLPRKDLPIRWVRAVSLLDGRLIYVPASMVYLNFNPEQAERIVVPITTGCAAHVDFERAIINGILEVLERDALTLTWLQKFPLKRLAMDVITEPLAPVMEQYERASASLENFLFDASLDHGVPTVYGIQKSRSNQVLTTVVACSSALNFSNAAAKVLKDFIAVRKYLEHQDPPPTKFSQFTKLHHGPKLLAKRESESVFDFLLQSKHILKLSETSSIESRSPGDDIRELLDIFRRKRWDVYVVDITPDEGVRSGLVVVRVLIPKLQPFSYDFRARYLGHPRLYEVIAPSGRPPLPEEGINPWPQPFA